MSFSFHVQQHPLAVPKKVWPFLCQKKFWVNSNYEQVRIKDMDLDYIVSTMNWLMRRAPMVKFSLELYYRQNPEYTNLVADMAGVNPYYWIQQTELFKRLLIQFDKLSSGYGNVPKIGIIQSVADIDNESDRIFEDASDFNVSG